MIGFSYPVVPHGQGAHPHADVSAAHTAEQIDDRRSPPSREVGRELGVIGG